MLASDAFLGAAGRRGLRFYTGVPCSYLKPFINSVIDDPSLRYVGAANEGDAVAIAAGAELAGERCVVMFQNSGLGNAVNPLSSLTHPFRIPMLLVPTLRAEPGGEPDEPQHELMGRITGSMLETLEIPWEAFPRDEAGVEAALDRATAFMEREGRPYALVMSKGTVEPRALASEPERRPPPARFADPDLPAPARSRRDMLVAIQASVDAHDVVVATTGYTGRELFALDDRHNQLYMVGSMGCASSLGLGLALAQPARRVVVIDGDGAALMRLGALATVGYERPRNLVHVLLDNRVHESTGGQATVSHSIDFCGVASACGYGRVARTVEPDGVEAFLGDARPGPAFVHVPIVPGTPSDLPRPNLRPEEVARRLRGHLAASSKGRGQEHPAHEEPTR